MPKMESRSESYANNKDVRVGCRKAALCTLVAILTLFPRGTYGRLADDNKSAAPPSTLTIELPAPEGEVLQAVKIVSGDEIIHGSQIYDKEPILDGAFSAASSDYYGKWDGGGQVFYKVRTQAIAPRHFKASADMGTITVRYVVEGLSAMNTKLQIDAVFVGDGGHRVHPSDGSVETSEFKEIQDRIRAIDFQKRKDAEALQARQAYDAKIATANKDQQRAGEIERMKSAEASLQNLKKRLHELQHELEVRPKTSDAELKTAPFHKATTLRAADQKEELLVLIITPNWYGIETTDGQHAWIARDQVEALP
jgi:hypothetical protein